jgi:5'-nucleotidase
MAKFLLTNDDGHFAQGIQELASGIESFGEVFVIAPDKERSSCGHGISLTEPIRCDQVKKNTYSCSGLPADCVLVGLGAILKSDPPDLVISGINHGANLGQDRFYSGTVAAAREASLRNKKAISISLVTKSGEEERHFQSAVELIKIILQEKLYESIPKFCLININVPNISWENISGVKLSCPGFQDYTEEVVERIDARGRKYFWLGGNHQGHLPIDGSDCNAVSEGYISIDLQDNTGRGELTAKAVGNFKELIDKIKWKNY